MNIIIIDHIDVSLQIRSLCEETVEEYVEAMKHSEFPPASIVCDEATNTFYMTDGFHRRAARLQNGETTIDADVTYGTRKDALWAALGGNSKNGMRLGPGDKRKAVEIALREFPGKSTRAIAEHIGCSHMTVQREKSGVTNVTPDAEKDQVRTTTHLKFSETGSREGSEDCAKSAMKIDFDLDEIEKMEGPIQYPDGHDPAELYREREESEEEDDDIDWPESEYDEEENDEPEKVTGRDGKQYPAKREAKGKPSEEQGERTNAYIPPKGEVPRIVEFEEREYGVWSNGCIGLSHGGRVQPGVSGLDSEDRRKVFEIAFPPPPYTKSDKAWAEKLEHVLFQKPIGLTCRTHEGRLVVESTDSQKPTLRDYPLVRGLDWENWPIRAFFEFSDCDLESFDSVGVKTVGDLAKVVTSDLTERITVPKFGKKKMELLEEKFVEFWKQHPELCQS